MTSIIVLYGPRTTALVACDDGVYEFTCGAGNQWIASRERIQIKKVRRRPVPPPPIPRARARPPARADAVPRAIFATPHFHARPAAASANLRRRVGDPLALSLS